MNPSEHNPMDPALERAVSDIRDEPVDPAVVEAAAARVWSNLVGHAAGSHIRNCSDFQALFADYRAGRLAEARATLLKDHLHECVACRRAYEGKVIMLPVAAQARKSSSTARWAAAAAIVAAAGLSVWVAVDRFGGGVGRAIVQSVHGTLHEISATGIRPLAAGQDLPDGVEIRTAKDSDAVLELRDGSLIELRERSSISTTQAARDLTVHLRRGSIIVQAAQRRKGSLLVATADVRVAVTGTVFSVSSGLKGSRVSVIEGEVRVTQNNEEKLLRPGEQSVSSTSLEPLSVKEEISWSRNRDRLVQQMNALVKGLQQIPLPGPRYSSKLLGRLPAGVAVYASVPNLSEYLGQAQAVFARNMAENPELRAWWLSRDARIEAILEKLRAGSEYLGEEIAIVGFAAPNGGINGPVFLAETKREGFPEYLKKHGPLPLEMRSGLAIFGPERRAVDLLAASLDGGLQGTPFYTQIDETLRAGAGFLFAADVLHHAGRTGARYFVAAQKEVNRQNEVRATVGFDGHRGGIAAWLADPAPMGSLDYVSPEATLVAAFVVKDPAVIVDELTAVARPLLRAGQQPSGTADVRKDLAQTLGGEFSLSIDGSLVPVPSWKLVTEVYDPARAQAALQRIVDTYNRECAKTGAKPLRTSQETVDGRTYYMVAGGDPNPLTEAHYTFADGYLVAGPSRALVTRALQTKINGTSIRHSAQFAAMVPRDRYNNFSALLYQNMGKTLAPLVGLFQGFVPDERGRNAMAAFGDLKPALVTAYAEPNRITVAGNGDFFRAGMTNMLSGNLSNILGSALPIRNFR